MRPSLILEGHAVLAQGVDVVLAGIELDASLRERVRADLLAALADLRSAVEGSRYQGGDRVIVAETVFVQVWPIVFRHLASALIIGGRDRTPMGCLRRHPPPLPGTPAGPADPGC